MEKRYRLKRNLRVVLSAFITVALLCCAIISTVSHVYNDVEEEAYEMLHLETQQIKNDINLQFYSDRENLITMANFASKLYEDGEDYSMLFKSFQEIGLFEDVRILRQDNSLVSKNGTIPGVDDLDFAEEIKKGTYVSGRVVDLVNKNKEVVRSAVPIVDSKGTTVGMIYGIVDLQKFEDRYLDDIKSVGGDLFVADQRTGNFIIDTKRDNFGNITELSKTTFEDGYSYDDLAKSLALGENGFVSFDSIVTGAKLYAHYAPLEFAQWEIMVAKPATNVFADARKTGTYMVKMSIILILIMFAYVISVFIGEKNDLDISTNASVIRKRLLEANQDQDKTGDALELIKKYAKASYAFFIDSNRETYNCFSKSVLNESQQKYFIDEVFDYVIKNKKKSGINVNVFRVKADEELKTQSLWLYKFLIQHKFKLLDLAVVSNDYSSTSILCVVNSKNRSIEYLLKDIAICFSMTVYNKKHLTKTESMALTDALTGVGNRMAYKNDVKNFSSSTSEKFTCVYIDVNELNYYNNKYGHAAGDQMLIFIAETLSNEFKDGYVYRMGGDEFLIFIENVTRENILERIDRANKLIEEMKYHISVGIKKKEPDMTLEELVNDAEKRMYLEKTKYYQEKHNKLSKSEIDDEVKILKTGVNEVDAYLDILQNKYYGVYYVSTKTDRVIQLLSPSYLDIDGVDSEFSVVLKQYIHDYVIFEQQRTLLNFIQYDLLEQQLSSGEIPVIKYTKNDGSNVTLTIWPVSDEFNIDADTIWTFEK